jgi:GT2 family glycosyltransferase
MTVHVAVAIVGFRNPDDIVRCLAALARSRHADFEVVICENGGAEAFQALTEVLPTGLAGGQPVRAVMAPRNLGYAGGVNVCLAESPNADAWWVLNPDTEPYPDAMGAMLARLAVGDCEAVGNTLYLPNGKVQSHGGWWQTWLGRTVSIGHSTPQTQAPDPAAVERRQNFLNGASMLIGRRFLQVVGPMREEYFLYFEEVEWCLRGLELGMRLGFAPDAIVLHHGGTTTGNTTDYRSRSRMPIYLNERNKMLVTRDCFPTRLPIVALTSLVTLFAKYGRRGAWAQLGFGVSGWMAGLRNERGADPLFRAGT